CVPGGFDQCANRERDSAARIADDHLDDALGIVTPTLRGFERLAVSYFGRVLVATLGGLKRRYRETERKERMLGCARKLEDRIDRKIDDVANLERPDRHVA